MAARRRRTSPRREPTASRSIFAEGVAIVVMAFAVLLALSLVSHSNTDPVAWPLGNWHGEPVANWAGIVGSVLSESLFQTFGWAAWTAPLLMLLVGWRTFWRRPTGSLVGVAGSLLVLVSLTACLQLTLGERGPIPAHPAGGWIGYIAGRMLSRPLNRWGGLVVALALAGTGGLLLGRSTFVDAVRATGARLARATQAAWLAWVRWREARRRERQRAEVARRQRDRQGQEAALKTAASEPRAAAPIPVLPEIPDTLAGRSAPGARPARGSRLARRAQPPPAAATDPAGGAARRS